MKLNHISSDFYKNPNLFELLFSLKGLVELNNKSVENNNLDSSKSLSYDYHKFLEKAMEARDAGK